MCRVLYYSKAFGANAKLDDKFDPVYAPNNLLENMRMVSLMRTTIRKKTMLKVA